MKITYDNEVDALYIRLKQAKSAKQQIINDDIIADFDVDGNLTGLEVLNAISLYGGDLLNMVINLQSYAPPKLNNYTAAELAGLMGLNKETILRKIRTGEIQATRSGRSYKIPEDEAKRLLKTA